MHKCHGGSLGFGEVLTPNPRTGAGER